jgi:hypothetical protein
MTIERILCRVYWVLTFLVAACAIVCIGIVLNMDQEHDRTDMLVLPISVLLLSFLEAYLWRGAEHWSVLAFLGCGWVALAALSAEVIAAVALHSDVLQDFVSTHQFEAVTSLDCGGTNATVLRLCALLGRETDLFEAASWVAWILAATSGVRAACLFNRTVAGCARTKVADAHNRDGLNIPAYWDGSCSYQLIDDPRMIPELEHKMRVSIKLDTTHGMNHLQVQRVQRIENRRLLRNYQHRVSEFQEPIAIGGAARGIIDLCATRPNWEPLDAVISGFLGC